MQLQCGDLALDLKNPQVMGILNLTPDSFFDGGLYQRLDQALFRVEKMLEEGATIIDIGGESTRPGAKVISTEEELNRIGPTLEAILQRFPTIISVDTQKPLVMREAIRLGVHMINDVNALQAEGALEIVGSSQVAVCVMHKQGVPETMQQKPQYIDVVSEVKHFLQDRIIDLAAMNVKPNRILVDPGFGFGKTLSHNLTLLQHLEEFCDLGVSLMVGLSRKLEKSLGIPVPDRVNSSRDLACLAVKKGARILRTHHVGVTVQALKIMMNSTC